MNGDSQLLSVQNLIPKDLFIYMLLFCYVIVKVKILQSVVGVIVKGIKKQMVE